MFGLGDRPIFLKTSNEASARYSGKALKVPVAWTGGTPGHPVFTDNFYCDFVLHNTGIGYVWKDRITQTIKSVQLPQLEFETEKLNQYNRPILIHKNKKTGRLSITFYDTSDRAAILMIDDYTNHYYGDNRMHRETFLADTFYGDPMKLASTKGKTVTRRFNGMSDNDMLDPKFGLNDLQINPHWGYNATMAPVENKFDWKSSGGTSMPEEAMILSSQYFFDFIAVCSFIGGATTRIICARPKIVSVSSSEKTYDSSEFSTITVEFEVENMWVEKVSKEIDNQFQYTPFVTNTKVFEPSPDASPVSIFNTTLPFGGGNLSTKIISKLPVLRNEKIINIGKKLNELGAVVNPSFQNGVLGTFGSFDFGEMAQGTKSVLDWIDPKAIALNGATVANALTGMSAGVADIATSAAKSISNSGLLKSFDIASQAVSTETGLPLQGAQNLMSDVSTKYSIKSDSGSIKLGGYE